MHEAGYFHAISQNSKFTVNFVQIFDKALTSKTMEQITELEPEMILLYTNSENMELLMQEVTNGSHFSIPRRLSDHT